MNEKNELHNRELHINGLLKAEKVDIREEKVDIEAVKVQAFSAKTVSHIHRLFEEFGFNEIFGRGAVMELLELKDSGASKFLSKLLKEDIIESVAGYGKGKYRFKKNK